MKRFTLALSMIAVLALTACANGGGWTPMSGGRTAGEGQTVNSNADRTFDKAMHK